MHANPGGQGRQRPLGMGITHGTPAKTGQPVGACQFRHQPPGGKLQRPDPDIGRSAAPHGIHGQRVIATQSQRQRQHRQHGQHGRQSSVGVHGHIQPPGSRRQPNAAKDSRSARRRRWRCAAQTQMRHPRHARQLQPPDRNTFREPPIQRPTGGQRHQQPGQAPLRPGRQRQIAHTPANHAGPDPAHSSASAFVGATLNHFTAPPLVCNTRKSSPPRE